MEFALITIFCTSFLLALSGAIMPGPLLTVTISESGSRGAVAGPLLILGHGVLELMLVTALLSGLAPFLIRDDVFVVISLVGGAILLWMGSSMLKSLPELQLVRKGEQTARRNLVLAGALLSGVNPYWLIWWASIGLGYILHSMKYGVLGIVSFFTGHIIADLLWYALVSFGVARGSHLMSNGVYRRLVGGCAVFLLVFAGWFVYSGIVRATTLIGSPS